MDALEELIRLSRDKEDLKTYLKSHNVPLGNTRDDQGFLSQPDRVLDAVQKLPKPKVSEIMEEAVRIAHMARPGPQRALLEFFQDDKDYLSQPGQFDKSRWVFVNRPERFSAAEAYFDFSQSRGKVSLCRPFEGVPGLSKARLMANEGEFVRSVRVMIPGGQNMNVRAYDNVGADNCIQLILYKEALPVEELRYRDGELGSEARWPVHTYVVFYHPGTGRYEVVGKKDERQKIAEAISHCLMRNGAPKEAKHYGYELQSLLNKRSFTMSDGIYRIEILAIKVNNRDDKTIYWVEPTDDDCLYTQMAKKEKHSPLSGRVQVLAAKIRVQFSREGPGTRDKTVTFTITDKNSGLKLSLTEPEQRLLFFVYLRLWGLERLSPPLPAQDHLI